jgi:hypothetical protein
MAEQIAKQVVPAEHKFWVMPVFDTDGQMVGYFDRWMKLHEYPTFFVTAKEPPTHPKEFQFSGFDQYEYTVEYRSNRLN